MFFLQYLYLIISFLIKKVYIYLIYTIIKHISDRVNE